MAKKEQQTAQQLIESIKKRDFSPLYFLQGDESYYIDLITDALLEHVLNESEKDFNLTVLYGGDTSIETVISAAKRYPMMSEYQLVVLKEAQLIDNLDMLEHYASHPLTSTILVVNYKHKTFDARKKVMKEIAKNGVIFESKKLYEDKIPAFVQNYVAGKGLSIDGKAALMVGDFIGTDLNRLCSELDKLCVAINKSGGRITADLIEKNIGVSKDFNNFELLRAVIRRDVYKANQIQTFFAKDPKNNPLILTLIVFFNFFSNLMLAYYVPDKSEYGLMNGLKLKNIYAARDYQAAMKIYNAYKTMEIISLLREFDAKAKGFESNNVADAQLLKELLFKMMH